MKKLLNTLYIFTEDAYLSSMEKMSSSGKMKQSWAASHYTPSRASSASPIKEQALLSWVHVQKDTYPFPFSIVEDDSLQALSDPRGET